MSMTLQQLHGRQARLERELAAAFGEQPWPGALVERIAGDIAATERAIAEALRAEAPRAPRGPASPGPSRRAAAPGRRGKDRGA